MKKIATALLGAAVLASSGAAMADVTVHLNETYASGAVFDGNLTFNDGLDGLKGVTGLLTGGGYGSISFSQAYTLTAYHDSTGQDWLDGNKSTYEDWLVAGDARIDFGYTHLIGISWEPATDGVLRLHLSPLTDPNFAGVATYTDGTGFPRNPDAAISYNATLAAVPEPATYGMLLAGLGLVGAIARRKAGKA